MMDKLNMHTPNLADENYKKLAALFPNAVTEAVDPVTGEVVRAIDKDVLMQEINTRVVEGREERYQFTWPDKKKAVLEANAPIRATLRPVKADSVGRDGTPGGWDSENLYIEGDNLDVLKLLRETYLGKVKMIYIDPPYNTGNDFVYADDFAEDADSYMARSGQYDDMGNRLVQNTDSNGRFHTDWLNMIYPRLKIAKDLLSEDGLVFISIDDNELTNARKICDEVFGACNFIDTIIWKKRYGGGAKEKWLVSLQEYVLLYCKNADSLGELFVPLTKENIERYSDFVRDLQDQTRAVLYDRPTKATVEYFTGKTVDVDGQKVSLSEAHARQIYRYLVKNDYIADDDSIAQEYRDDLAAHALAPLPEALQPMAEGIHRLIQAIFDDTVLKDMFANGNETKAPENPLNDRFYREAFQTLWKAINHKYAYTVDFDSDELIRNAIAAIDTNLYVSRLQYTVSQASQRDALTGDMMREGNSFQAVKTRTETLKHAETSQIRYDLIGKIAEGTVLTRRTVAAILKGIRPETFMMFRFNPEEFISKVTRLIREQKATMIVEHITYDQIEGSYDSSIFTAEKNGKSLENAFPATKAIQDYVFTDGTAEKSVERRFVEELDGAAEVNIYAKLPKGFSIPTPVGHYSPDWAIVFHEGAVRHIYFVAETKGAMDSLNLRPIEKAKIDCAKKLFSTLSNGTVTYDHVDSYQQLMNKVMN